MLYSTDSEKQQLEVQGEEKQQGGKKKKAPYHPVLSWSLSKFCMLSRVCFFLGCRDVSSRVEAFQKKKLPPKILRSLALLLAVNCIALFPCSYPVCK